MDRAFFYELTSTSKALSVREKIFINDMDVIDKIFKCTLCGFCCQGETTVSLDIDDQKRMAESLNLQPRDLEVRFLKITNNIVQMKTEAGHCVFYKDGCAVHQGRPWRCAQWPLVPALLDDEDNFHIISDSCPGINNNISYLEFCDILKEYLRTHGNVIC